MFPCGTAIESRTHIVGECEIYEEDVLGETRKLDECDMEEFGRSEISEKTIAILGDRWPQTAKQDGDGISKQFHVIYGRSVVSAQMLEVSIWSRNGAPSRKGCVVSGQMTEAS